MKYTPEYMHITSSKYDCVSTFRKNEYNLYVAICRKGLREYYFAHMRGLSDTEKLSKKEILTIAKKYKTLKSFREREPKAVGRAKYFGIHDQVIKHMIRGSNQIWDVKSLRKEARKYNRMIDFIEGSRSAYVTMMRLRYKEKVAKHLI